jgi:hypothetical protein
MNTPTRYTMDYDCNTRANCECSVEKSKHGEYVDYEDYKALEAKLAASTKDYAKLQVLLQAETDRAYFAEHSLSIWLPRAEKAEAKLAAVESENNAWKEIIRDIANFLVKYKLIRKSDGRVI